MTLVGSYMQGHYFPFFALMRRELDFFDEILDQLQVAMLNNCKVGIIALFVLDADINTDTIDKIPDYIEISLGTGEVEGNFALGFLETIQKILDLLVLAEDAFLGIDAFLQVDEEEFDLGQFKGSDGVDDLLIEFGDGLVLLKLLCFGHQQLLLWLRMGQRIVYSIV